MELKEQMTAYWAQRAPGFSALRMREFCGEKHDQWLEELKRYLPADRSLDLLDVGTGTGFFAFLLSSLGHRVVGIDLTEEMILEARKAAKALGLTPEFAVMDGENPAFPPASFDGIVTRNLTWALPHLKKAYQSWYQLLKPGGVLVNFDGDYCREKAPQELPPQHAHKEIAPTLLEEYERLKEELRPLQRPRPQWDIQLLEAVGFHSIQVDTTVWQRVYGKQDEFYNPTPVFTIVARK